MTSIGFWRRARDSNPRSRFDGLHDFQSDDFARFSRAEDRLDHAHEPALLVVGDENVRLAVQRGDQVFVVAVPIRREIVGGQRERFDRFVRARRHRAGDACAGDDRVAVLLGKVGHFHDLAVAVPVLDDKRAVDAEDIPARQVREVVGLDLNDPLDAVFKAAHDGETVVALVVGDVRHGRVDAHKLGAAHVPEHLVEHVHAPVVQHPAAVFFFLAPAARDAARALHARLDAEHVAQVARIHEMLDQQEVAVEPAVLMDGEELARFVRRGDHFLKIGGAERDGLFGYDVLAVAQRVDRDLLVHVVGRGDHDHVDPRVAQQLFARRVGADALVPRSLLRFGVDVERADQFDAVDLLHLAGMEAAHAAVADDGAA